MFSILKKYEAIIIAGIIAFSFLFLFVMFYISVDVSKYPDNSSNSTTSSIEKIIDSNYLPSDLSIMKMDESSDKSTIQIITNEDYDDYNIPNLRVYLNKKVENDEIKDFDINTYQRGLKSSNDKIAIIIEK